EKNIKQWQSIIPIHELSAVFQDAVYTTHAMGFNFIWIDSLCIIQDDPQDWLQESKAMCQVYKGAVCNIAAS
ncbi:heterokaryon incompatibility, partial [Bimuria novae-zelandiae CBS 107.79]